MENVQEVIDLFQKLTESEEGTCSTIENSDTNILPLEINKISEPTSSASDDVLNLLQQWNLTELHEKFKEQAITIDVLKVIRPEHVGILMRDYKLGTQVSFGHHLNECCQSISASSFYNSKVSSSSCFSLSPTLSPTNSKYNCTCSTPEPEKFSVSLASILNETNTGAELTNYYEEH